MSYSFLIAAAIFIFGAVVHSVAGEKLLITPLLKRDLPPFLGSVTLARRTLRMAWHLTTVVWLGMAALLLMLANPLVDLRNLVPIVLAVVCIAMAALSLAVTRGTHFLSWVGSLVAAALILYGSYLSRT